MDGIGGCSDEQHIGMYEVWMYVWMGSGSSGMSSIYACMMHECMYV